jgi:phosphoserine phosphatase
VIAAFAARLAIEVDHPVEAVGTPLEVEDGVLTGRLAGPFNVAEAKARRVQEALGDERLAVAYGDTAADVPLLLQSEHPVAAYPDPTLRRIARERGWSVLDG